jgi:hypothetical protein
VGVAGLVDCTHSAFPELLENLVVQQPSTRHLGNLHHPILDPRSTSRPLRPPHTGEPAGPIAAAVHSPSPTERPC